MTDTAVQIDRSSISIVDSHQSIGANIDILKVSQLDIKDDSIISLENEQAFTRESTGTDDALSIKEESKEEPVNDTNSVAKLENEKNSSSCFKFGKKPKTKVKKSTSESIERKSSDKVDCTTKENGDYHEKETPSIKEVDGTEEVSAEKEDAVAALEHKQNVDEDTGNPIAISKAEAKRLEKSKKEEAKKLEKTNKTETKRLKQEEAAKLKLAKQEAKEAAKLKKIEKKRLDKVKKKNGSDDKNFGVAAAETDINNVDTQEELEEDESNVEEVKKEELKEEEVKEEDVKEEKVKGEDVKEEKVNGEDVKEEEANVEESNIEEVKEEESNIEEVKEEELKEEKVKEKGVKVVDVKEDGNELTKYSNVEATQLDDEKDDVAVFIPRSKSEKKRYDKDKKLEKTRLAREDKLEKKRLAKEEKLEKQRLAKEEKLEKQRLAKEKKEELKRLEADRKQELKRAAMLKKQQKKDKGSLVISDVQKDNDTQVSKNSSSENIAVDTDGGIKGNEKIRRTETTATKDTLASDASEEVVVANVLLSNRMSFDQMQSGLTLAATSEDTKRGTVGHSTQNLQSIHSLTTNGSVVGMESQNSLNPAGKEGKKIRSFLQRFSLQDTSQIPKRYSDQLYGSSKNIGGSRLNIVEAPGSSDVGNSTNSIVEEELPDRTTTEGKGNISNNGELERSLIEDPEVSVEILDDSYDNEDTVIKGVNDEEYAVKLEEEDDVHAVIDPSVYSTQKYIPSFNTITKSFRNAFKNMSASKEKLVLGVEDVPEHLKLQLYVMTWNMGGHIPKGNLNDMLGSLEDAIDPPYKGCHIVVICTQECEKPSNLSIKPEKKVWEQMLDERLEIFGYIRHATKTNAGLHIALYAICDVPIADVHAASCILNSEGIFKGAVAIGFEFGESSFCFINSHLSEGQNNLALRNKDFNRLENELVFTKSPKSTFMGSKLSDRFDYTFWCGDLNYRTWLGSKPVNKIPKNKKRLTMTLFKGSERTIDKSNDNSLANVDDKPGSIDQLALESKLKKRKSFLFRKATENSTNTTGNAVSGGTSATGDRARKARSFIFMKNKRQSKDLSELSAEEQRPGANESTSFGISQMTLGDQLITDDSPPLPKIADDSDSETKTVDSSKNKPIKEATESNISIAAESNFNVVTEVTGIKNGELSTSNTNVINSSDNIEAQSQSQLHVTDKKDKRKSLMTTLLRKATLMRSESRLGRAKTEKVVASELSLSRNKSSLSFSESENGSNIASTSSLASEIAAIDPEIPLRWIKKKCIHEFMEHDELRWAYTNKKAFAGFSEGEIKFLPTYKFVEGVDYPLDASESLPYAVKKGILPSYTDRILFKTREDHYENKSIPMLSVNNDANDSNEKLNDRNVIIKETAAYLQSQGSIDKSAEALNILSQAEALKPSDDTTADKRHVVPDSYNMHNVYLDVSSTGNSQFAINATDDTIMGPFSGELLKDDKVWCCEKGAKQLLPLGNKINREIQVKKYGDLVTITDSDHKPVYAKFIVPSLRLER